MKTNPFELLNRARKVAAFVLAAEEAAKKEGVPPWLLPGVVDRWEHRHWESLRVSLGHRKHPSDITKSSVVAMLCERVRRTA